MLRLYVTSKTAMRKLKLETEAALFDFAVRHGLLRSPAADAEAEAIRHAIRHGTDGEIRAACRRMMLLLKHTRAPLATRKPLRRRCAPRASYGFIREIRFKRLMRRF